MQVIYRLYLLGIFWYLGNILLYLARCPKIRILTLMLLASYINLWWYNSWQLDSVAQWLESCTRITEAQVHAISARAPIIIICYCSCMVIGLNCVYSFRPIFPSTKILQHYSVVFNIINTCISFVQLLYHH